MHEAQLTTPVALFIFNRPDTTTEVFSAIREVRPSKLLVVADGPRLERHGEVELCRQARCVAQDLDWPCHIETNFSDENMGCMSRISTGLDWVFSKVEEAIILEDDCVPDPSFFRFCEELLEKFRFDERIAQISGVNYQFGRKRTEYSYYFSRYNHIWGWASWRRAWRRYDVDMKAWPEVKKGNWLKDILGDETMAKYWEMSFDKAYNKRIDTWDFQWTFTCWINNQLTILPNRNLISNIGFSGKATHTTDPTSIIANMPWEKMIFPLSHPRLFVRDSESDAETEKILYRIGKLRALYGRLSCIGRRR
jgi:hypothetical protein